MPKILLIDDSTSALQIIGTILVDAGHLAPDVESQTEQTLRNIAAAWVFTLPVAALLSGTLFWLFRHFA